VVQRGGVHEAGERRGGLADPEREVLHAGGLGGGGEGRRALQGDGGLLAALKRVPPECGQQAADALGVEYVQYAVLPAQ
jgi:hypothetical protein